jgi:hypothetical protein
MKAKEKYTNLIAQINLLKIRPFVKATILEQIEQRWNLLSKPQLDSREDFIGCLEKMGVSENILKAFQKTIKIKRRLLFRRRLSGLRSWTISLVNPKK